ncbi:hypothetical protein PWT90_03638 [Aphanocladium album]|nr:hypothetical protein PWT90_03638 [Aphanocladium album]
MPASNGRFHWQSTPSPRQGFTAIFPAVPARHLFGTNIRRERYSFDVTETHQYYPASSSTWAGSRWRRPFMLRPKSVTGEQKNCTIFIITGLGIQTLSLVLMFGTCAVTQYLDKGIRRLAFQEGRRQMNRGLQVAGVLLFTHSVYRIVEICLSVSGTLFQGELAFMLANGALPLVSCVLLITFHPKKIDRSPAALTSSWSGKRKERPPPLTHGNAHPAHHGYSPNIALQISPTSPKSQSSNPPAVPSGSPGLPVNPRPTHQSISFQPVRAPAQASVNHYKNKKDDRQPRELVETDSLW